VWWRCGVDGVNLFFALLFCIFSFVLAVSDLDGNKLWSLGLCILLVSSFGLVFTASTVEAAEVWVDITLPNVITSAGNYNVSAGFANTEQTAVLIISADNVVVNGNGHTIEQVNPNDVGVFAMKPAGASNIVIGNFSFTMPTGLSGSTNFINYANFDGVEIGNCTFQNSDDYAIQLSGVNSYIYNCTFEGNMNGINYGAVSSGSANGLLSGCVFVNNRYSDITCHCDGMVFENFVGSQATTLDGCSDVAILGSSFTGEGSVNAYDCTDVVVDNCTFVDSYGVFVTDVQNLLIQHSVFTNHSYSPIMLMGSGLGPLTLHDNVFLGNSDSMSIAGQNVYAYNNYFGDDLVFASSSVFGSASSFSIEPTDGVRITGGIGQIGGNFWANSTGNGYSQIAEDVGDGFAAPYTIGFGQVDEYPLVLTEAISPPPTPTPTPPPTVPLTFPPGSGGGGGGWLPSPSPTSPAGSAPTSPPTWLGIYCHTWLLILLVVLLLIIVCAVALWSDRR